MSASGRKRRHHEEEHENHERWLVTYADMLTVLMALFIVMFALSVVDKKKFEEFKNGLNDKPGAGENMLAGGDGLLTVPTSKMTVDVDAAVAALKEKHDLESAAAEEKADLEAAREAIKRQLASKGMSGSVRFRIDERGLVVTVVTDDVLFELGSATLRPAGTAVLDAIAPALKVLPNPVTVEGHTDDLPISGGPFPSNWELSTERATSVLRYVLERHQLPARRLSAAGYADTRPIAPSTPAGRSTNRRVEVVVRAVAAAPGTATAVPARATAPETTAPKTTAPKTTTTTTAEQAPRAAAVPDEENH